MVFVTGGTGLLGTRLLFDLVKNGAQVRALKRATSDLELVKSIFNFYDAEKGPALFDQIEWFEGDILDVYSLEEGIAGCEKVFHCAAMVSFHRKDKRALNLINQKGTANMVNISIEKGVKHFCHISSIATIGKGSPQKMLNENEEWKVGKHNSNYAISKYGAEREVWRGMQEGLPAAILNPGIILGLGDEQKSSASLFGLIKNGMKFYTTGSASVVDVRDVSKVALLASDQQITSERYILVGENGSFKNLLDEMAQVMDKKAPNIKAGRWLSSLTWRFFAAKDRLLGTKSTITKESARSANTITRYDSQKAKEKFNLDFTSLKDSVAYFAPFYK